MNVGTALRKLLRPARCSLALLVLVGCASTTIELNPSPQAPVCDGAALAQVIWATRWRTDQKDIPARDAAAAQGVSAFFDQSRCFSAPTVLRVSPDEIALALAERRSKPGKVVVIVVRELGPTLAVGASAALVEGATEVKLEVSEFIANRPAPRAFTAQWRNGGPGVIKGVASLPQDLQAALAAALQPAMK